MSTSTSTPENLASGASGRHSLSVLYSENEDRLVLLLETQGVTVRLLLTRRLTGGLINALADVLAQASPGARQAPLGMRESVVLFEHHEAVQAGVRQKATAGKAPPHQASASPLLPPILVTVVDISKKADSFALTFKAPQPITAFKLSLPELHQVLDLLRGKALAAQWSLNIEAGWLDASASKQRMN